MKLFTIGPTEMYETTKLIREKGVPYFRNQSFSNLMLETDAMLKRCMKTAPSSETIYLTASGTAAMEAAVDNLIRKTDRVLIVEGGGFGKRFVEICDRKGIQRDVLHLEQDECLTADHFVPFRDQAYKAVLINLHETSTGQLYDIGLLKKFCEGKETLLIVDAISTFLCDPFSMDDNGIDAVIISSQKGLCVTPGMSMVVLNHRTVTEYLKKPEEMECYYHCFADYITNMKRGQTPFTPAVGICYEIHDMLKYIEAQGLEVRLEEVREKAETFRREVKLDGIQFPAFPASNAITTVIFDRPVAKKIEAALIEEYGFVINPCGGDVAETRFRVSHVGAITVQDTVELARGIQKLYLRYQ
ncbi:MAG: alanine--glyoxylate aminotransferase family protein [Firmicutes bacterium]|nr:alanine--glyoxylate aminotransferase family protein [Bacillota bacterium]